MEYSKNTFFDINQFPKDWGLIIFPISMSRIANAQSPQKCIDSLKFFLPKLTTNKAGANFIYSEGLYMNFEKDARKSKNRFAQNAVSHMGAIQKLVTKNYRQFQIESAFHFDSWFQMYLSHNNFFSVLSQVKKLYKEDGIFQKYVTLDARNQEKELTPKQIDFYLEEHAFAYLLLNQRLHLQNDFVNNRESWILLTYPGDPPLGQIYLHQKDPLTIKEFSTNPYKGQYNLITRKFIDYEKFDLNLVQLH